MHGATNQAGRRGMTREGGWDRVEKGEVLELSGNESGVVRVRISELSWEEGFAIHVDG